MRRRFYLSPAEWGNEISFSLTGDEAHHCRHVVRAKVGDVFELIDGQGRSVPVRVAEFSGKQVEMSPVGESEYQPQKLPLIHLAFAMPKGKNFDLVIQKTTELGVDRIIPLITERTITRPSGKKGALLKKVESGSGSPSRRPSNAADDGFQKYQLPWLGMISLLLWKGRWLFLEVLKRRADHCESIF